jgi:hypothetical protein
MVARDLHDVLMILHDAGERRVPASELAWKPDMAPAINRAISMQYIVYRDGAKGRRFSLTKAGYAAIGRTPPNATSLSGAFRSLFGFGR